MTVAVGFGSGVITPALPVTLAGFGQRKGEVHEVRHELEARAVVVRDGDTTLCLLVLDLLLLGPDVAGPVRAAVAGALGVPSSAVLTACTHTHSGPAAGAMARRAGWPMPPGYPEVVAAGCVEAATAARDALEPAALAFAGADLPEGLSFNRRDLPYAPRCSVLEVTRPDGTRIGTLANVGIHPVALGTTARAVSGDWVTTYRQVLEARTGAPAVLLQGALGDVNPGRYDHDHPAPTGNWDLAETIGREVAEVVEGLLGRVAPMPATAAVVAHRQQSLRAGLTLGTVLTGTSLRRVDVELFEWRLGDVRVVSVPGEAFHALGRAIERSRGDRAMVAGIAPVWQGYLPAPFRSGYEETMSLGRRFVGPLRDLLVAPPTEER